MATRTEMEAELEILRAKLAETEKDKAAAVASDKSPPADETGASGTGTGAESATADETATEDAAPNMEHAKSELDRLLSPYGVSVEEIESLAEQLWAELETMPQKKPLTSMIAAFALGFLVGRLSK